jgi:hypothetical protein
VSRLSEAQLLPLSRGLSDRRWALLRAVAAMRLVTGGQLRRHFYAGLPSGSRLARLDLAYLFEQRILHRLERRIGGRRAGSESYVYALGSVGRRLLELEKGQGLPGGRSRYEPTVGFVTHALAVSEVWVGLHDYLRDSWTGRHDVEIDFQVERAAWRTYLDVLGARTTLKPDAELCITRQGYVEHSWIEVDLATERRHTLHGKLAAYVAYFHTGHEQARTGMFPLTVWLTTTSARVAVIDEVIAGFAPDDRRLFRVGHLSAASPLLLSLGGDE